MSTVLGHHRQLEYLNKVLKRGRLAHAYLFYGPEHVGKFTVARMLAKSLHYHYRGETSIVNVCNECGKCQMIDRRAHPGVTIIDPALSRKGGAGPEVSQETISIAEIRELKRSFSLGASGNEWRVAIINQAERMTPEAANAFLKLLEEPGERTLFILVTSDREALLPTVVSRSVSVRFSSLPESEMKAFVEGCIKDRQRIDAIVAQSFGRPGLALQYIQDNAILEKEQKIARGVAQALRASDIPTLLRIAERASSEKEIRTKVVEYTFRALRAGLVSGKGRADTIKKCSRIAAVLETTNVNPRLAMDAMLLEASLLRSYE